MKNALRPIATDTHDFPSLRQAGKIYVDKTMFIHQLVTDASSSLFIISRPRRFGKSLTVSALKGLFQGRRDLFKGLAIEKTDWKWQKFPVIHFEFNDVATTSLDEFKSAFAAHVRERLEDAGYAYDESLTPYDNFGRAIESLSARNAAGGRKAHSGVAILIDEYDAPIGQCLDDIAKAEAVRDILSALYSKMKNRTGDIRFLFMTGVSKFTKLSVFSSLNNLVDVSQDDRFATMFGYTDEELTANFDEHLRAHAKKMGRPYAEYRAEMKRWYNGFRFAKGDATTVYNPISIALTLYAKDSGGFTATWATTGRPSMLMNYLRREDLVALDYENMTGVADAEFDVADLRNLTAVALLYQSGYLTIKDYDADGECYTLGVPDEEIRRDLATLVTGVAADSTDAWAANLGKALINAKWPQFFAGLKSLYAHMPYGALEGTVHEHSYGRILCTLLASQGIAYRAEDVQSNGRADVVAEYNKGVFIFELKVGKKVDRAFRQIRRKGYAAPYMAQGKPIWLIGLCFDKATRRLVDCAAAPLVVVSG